jgi:glycosyltransferase involved in cell wall biosynthesis
VLSNALLATRGRPVKQVGYRGTMGHLSRLDPAAWMTYFSHRVDKIICVSGAVERYLQNCGVANERLVTIHKGHDPDWYAHNTSISLEEFGIPEHAFVVGFVGNIRPVKGADVLLEAMSQGIPVVVSNVGGMPELVKQEVCGLIVPPRNSQAFASALQRLASHPNEVERLGIAAQERIKGPFHVRHTLDKTIKLYTELLGKSG